MSPLALLLVLGAACAHAGWNVLAHGTSRLGVPFLWCGAVASTLLWATVVPLTGGLGKAGLAGFLWGVGVSAVVHVAYMLVLQRGYRSIIREIPGIAYSDSAFVSRLGAHARATPVVPCCQASVVRPPLGAGAEGSATTALATAGEPSARSVAYRMRSAVEPTGTSPSYAPTRSSAPGSAATGSVHV
ncbi:hypothetical protein [Microbacterium lacticum]|uniref:hypothetical protein n=1 Tax=Microbacterium lacticum TaxID=33885 RepID=UPI0011428A19|nr:hypothetical protein [Microbacterium lacticum]GEB95589.1 hypothetical protein MLA01_18080 [Microbacterium lacticum]GGN14805.1 hypothetical protein GCM10009724_05440 [Microbacterium lacticum]